MPAKDCRIVFAARGQAELVELQRDPRPLGPAEVAGRTLVSLVSPGTELAVYQGQHAGSRFPCGTGYAAVMQVESAGAEVAGIRPGDRCFCMGPHQSFQRLPAAEALRIGENLSPEAAVFARMMGISMATLATTSARPPAKVLVTGLGLVGNLAAQVFAACGYEVIGCDPDAARRELAERSGIGAVLPAPPLDDPAVAGKVALVVECSGHEGAALEGCRVVAKGGEVVLVGVPWVRRSDLSAHELLHAVFHDYVVLRSGWEWQLPRHGGQFHLQSTFGNFAAALEWIRRGRVRVEGLAESASPRAAQEAYQRLLNRRIGGLTVLFDWRAAP